MPAWPSTLPTPKLPVGYEPEDTVIRTEMEKGPPRARRRSLAVPPTRYDITWPDFSRLEMDVFEAWHHFTIADGATWFTMSMASGRGITTMECLFVGPWKASLVGENAFRVTAPLLVRNRTVMPQGTLANYL